MKKTKRWIYFNRHGCPECDDQLFALVEEPQELIEDGTPLSCNCGFEGRHKEFSPVRFFVVILFFVFIGSSI